MSTQAPKPFSVKQDCPLNDNNIDVIPESYHSSNRCLCFMCTCGSHICPNQKRSTYAKDAFRSSYKRYYSRPSSVTPTPQRVSTSYHKNNQKMDLETEYRKQFPEFKIEYIPITEQSTPQQVVKFDGKSQYNRDFPN